MPSTTAFTSVKAEPPIPGTLLRRGEPVSGRAPSAQVGAMLSARRNLLRDLGVETDVMGAPR